MKSIVKVGLALTLALGLAAALQAGDETTVTGNVMCAKCTLKKADASKCQDVLVTKDADGTVAEYYIEKTAAAEAFGHVCQSEKKAVVTGTVTEKDGKTWIAPTKMAEASS
jgi:phosphosulfolactate phosphohydrolase-like enzyme